MTNDRKQELERLEKELLADIAEKDDLLADIPLELLDTTPATWDDDPVTEEDLSGKGDEPEDFRTLLDQKEAEPMKQPAKKTAGRSNAGKKREERVLITLMTIASFLSLGIIAVLIYWLEVFLK